MSSPFVSLLGRRFGLGPNGPVFEGRIVGQPIIGRNTYWYVDSAVAGADGRSPSTAVATIVAALAKAAAGDTIVVLPGHTENVAAAGGITVSLAGISIIGLGYGAQRPKVTLNTANTASIVVTGASLYVENMVFMANFLAIAACFDVQAVDFWIKDCAFGNTASSKNFTTPIKGTLATSNLMNGMRVTGCRWATNGDTAGGPFISVAGTNLGYRIYDNFVSNAATTVAQLISVAAGKLLVDADIGWNRLFNLMTSGELFISNDGTTNTGIIHNNYVGHADVTGTHDPGWDAGGFRLFNNQSTSVDNLQGLLIPAADANL